ncbi:hypothetical protein GCM10010468_81670 [Actinocorallia longicatena]|uniref:Uncharacterized protein n=1 Tax=Actinocorallia longicatena TaxID=111803 RepID=A0ABP6QRX7_9ACTN
MVAGQREEQQEFQRSPRRARAGGVAADPQRPEKVDHRAEGRLGPPETVVIAQSGTNGPRCRPDRSGDVRNAGFEEPGGQAHQLHPLPQAEGVRPRPRGQRGPGDDAAHEEDSLLKGCVSSPPGNARTERHDKNTAHR